MDSQTNKRSRSDSDTENDSYACPSACPRFLLIESSDANKPLSKLSPFVIEKCLVSIASSPKSCKKLRSGALLVEFEKPQHVNNLLKIKSFFNIPATCKPHVSLNTSKGLIRCPDLADVPETEIVSELKSQNVTQARRIHVYRNGVKTPTNTIVLTFNSAILPRTLKIGYLRVNVEMYIPNPLQCFKCFKFGHHENNCRADSHLCRRCGDLTVSHVGNDVPNCKRSEKCINCDGDHMSTSRVCPVWIREKEIVTVKYKENLSFPEARKIINNRMSLHESYANIAKSQTTKPVTKDAQTQTTTATQTVAPSPQDQKKQTTKTTQSSSASKQGKTAPKSPGSKNKNTNKSVESDRTPKGCDDPIKQFNRYECLEVEMQEPIADQSNSSSSKTGRIIKLTS